MCSPPIPLASAYTLNRCLRLMNKQLLVFRKMQVCKLRSEIKQQQQNSIIVTPQTSGNAQRSTGSECFSTPWGRGEASACMLIYSFYLFLLWKGGLWRDPQVRNEARLTSIPNCSGNGFSFFCEMRRVLGISFLMLWRKEKHFKRTWKCKDLRAR